MMVKTTKKISFIWPLTFFVLSTQAMSAPYPDKLSAWNIFTRDQQGTFHLNDNHLPYELRNALFSDYASKLRTISIPSGKKILYRDQGVLLFPEGTVLSKTFFYKKTSLKIEGLTETTSISVAGSLLPILQGQHLLETRLLVSTAEGWVPLTYVWNQDQAEATLTSSGKNIPLTWTHSNGDKRSFNYKVPSQTNCLECHQPTEERVGPLGPRAANLNRDFDPTGEGRLRPQLTLWRERGWIETLPDNKDIPQEAVWDQPTTGTLDQRAKGYLAVNCAHCHNPQGVASHLLLNPENSERNLMGVCLPPTAPFEERKYVISPGLPQDSTLIYRLNSNQKSEMMPRLGRNLVHLEGKEMIEEWITQMNDRCQPDTI